MYGAELVMECRDASFNPELEALAGGDAAVTLPSLLPGAVTPVFPDWMYMPTVAVADE